MMTWDEDKRRRNRRAHGLDFAGCEAVFDGPVLAQDDNRFPCGEQHINLLGFLRGDVVFMTYTERDDQVHVISLRKATPHEIGAFARWLSRQH